MENHIQLADVKPETVGQYTGLHDENEKEMIHTEYQISLCLIVILIGVFFFFKNFLCNNIYLIYWFR